MDGRTLEYNFLNRGYNIIPPHFLKWRDIKMSFFSLCQINNCVFRITQPYLNLLVKPRFFFKFSRKNNAYAFWKAKCLSKCIKLYFFLEKKIICVPTLPKNFRPVTAYFFIWPYLPIKTFLIQWFIYNFELMGPGTHSHCFPYQWAQMQTCPGNVCVFSSLFTSWTLFFMTSLQYHCILGLTVIKTLPPREEILSKRCRMHR